MTMLAIHQSAITEDWREIYWKRRNNTVFRQQLDPLGAVLRAARDDARSWGSRLPHKDLHIGLSWCSIIESAM